MKKLLLIILLGLTIHAVCQNNAPIAVNDTFYVNYNDTFFVQPFNGSYIYSNDSDPDGDNIFIDTAFYFGAGFFDFTTIIVTSSTAIVLFEYKPPLNYWGLDSLQYILRDDGMPVKYDTAWIYFKVKYDYEYLDINNIKARVGLFNLFSDDNNSIADFNVPKQSSPSAPKYTSIYAANLWIAGKNQDSVYASCETFGLYYLISNPLKEFAGRGGPIMDSIHYKQGYDYEWDRLWKVNIQDIIYHQNNWSNTGYQAPEAIENWPAHGDTAKGQAFYLAPFVDNNSDGIYNPYDGDYPKIKGQQAIYFIYNDIRFQANTNKPMKSEVHYMAYAYNCPSDSALNNTVFVDYTIYNRSNLTYDSTYIGMWTDFDIGNTNDDYVGCDVQRSTFYGYNGDYNDENSNGISGYGIHPPAQGIAFLKGAPQDDDGMDNPLAPNVAQAYAQNGIVYPNLGLGFGDGITDNEYWGMEHFVYYNNGGGLNGAPSNSNGYYNYLKGNYLDNTPILWGGFGGTIPAKYVFPDNSDPLYYGTYGVTPTPATWSEFTSGNPPGDRRGLGSTGPFTFEPDSSVEIILAFVFGRDYQDTVSGNLASIVVMQERVDSLHSYYRNGFTTTACGTTLSVQEDNMDENTLQVYPNPFNNEITINYELKNSQAQLKVFDVYGKQVISTYLQSNQSKLNLSQQAKGVYFIQLIDGNKVLTKKVIKQ